MLAVRRLAADLGDELGPALRVVWGAGLGDRAAVMRLSGTAQDGSHFVVLGLVEENLRCLLAEPIVCDLGELVPAWSGLVILWAKEHAVLSVEALHREVADRGVKQSLILGLSDADLDRLRRQPFYIKKDLRRYAFGWDGELLITYGATHHDLAEEFASLVGPETRTGSAPGVF